jgi:hypothetical protein
MPSYKLVDLGGARGLLEESERAVTVSIQQNGLDVSVFGFNDTLTPDQATAIAATFVAG